MLHSFSQRPRWWLAVVQVVLLLATMVVPAAAATEPEQVTGLELIQLMRSYGIVKGDDQGNFNLDKPIKRAEMITIMVRALGAEQDAEVYKGLSPFTDAKGHWAEGNIAYAMVKGLVKGDGNNLVRPEDPITYAEALTLVLRLVKKEPSSGDWPLNIFVEAVTLGLMPPGITAGDAKDPAIRGQVFQSMGTAITTIKTESGKTFLQTYVDATPPSISVTAPPRETKLDTIKIEGSTTDAVRVTVNGSGAAMSGKAFSTNVTLAFGENLIKVQAWDQAGNTAEQQVNVTRKYPVTSLEVSGPTSVRIGETVSYTVAGRDEKGSAVPVSDLQVTVSGNIGTYNSADSTFKASNVSGTGSITFKSGSATKKLDVSVLGLSTKAKSLRIAPVNNGQTVAVTRPMTVTVNVVDIDNQLVTEDNGREITLEVSGIGLSVTPAKAGTRDGVATFTVVGTVPGTITLTAKSANVISSVQLATFGTSTRVVLAADSTSLTIGGTPSLTRIRAELRDDSGNLVTNGSGSDIVINASQTGAPGVLVDQTLTIRRGFNSSNASSDDAQFNVSSDIGQTLISGIITSGHPYSVDPVTLYVSRPSVGGGSKLQILNVNSGLTPNTEGTVILRVVDGNGSVISSGNYAFRIKVDTNNGETKTNGLPQGVTLTLGSTGYIPVDTGTAPSGMYVYGRTTNGSATLRIRYDKSGVVTLTPVVVGYIGTAYSDDGSSGPGLDSNVLTATADRVVYSGTVSKLGLSVDSSIGTNQPAGAASASSANYFTLRAAVQDNLDGRIPGATNPVTLAPVGTATYTTPPTFPSDTQNAVDGKAEFRVYAKTSVGCDTYRVSTAGGINSSTVELCVRNAAPAEARIITIRGTGGTNNRILTSDSGMEIELDWKTTGTDSWVSAVMYRNGAPIYTSDAVNMGSAAPRVIVPRSALSGGSYQYQIALKNGVGEGPRSNVSDVVTVDYQAAIAGFTSGRYDSSSTAGTGHKLTVYAYNLATAERIDASKLILKDASTGAQMDLTGADARVINGSQFTVDLSTAPAKQGEFETGLVSGSSEKKFSGSDVTIEALDGWYYQSNGASATAVTAKPITPMADITGVTFDVVANQLLITGRGFSTGTIDLSKLSITQGLNTLTLNTTNVSTWTRQSDTLLLVTLTTAGANTLKDSTKFNGSDALSAAAGWLVDSGFQNRTVTSVSVTAKVTVTSITYAERVTSGTTSPARLLILGNGFFSGGSASTTGSVDLAQLLIKDLSIPQQEALSGTGAGVNIISDGQIEITLDDTDATLFETTFAGTDIYIVGNSGWFKDFQNRSAEAIGDRYFRLTIN